MINKCSKCQVYLEDGSTICEWCRMVEKINARDSRVEFWTDCAVVGLTIATIIRFIWVIL